jgi:hypothetical protein
MESGKNGVHYVPFSSLLQRQIALVVKPDYEQPLGIKTKNEKIMEFFLIWN